MKIAHSWLNEFVDVHDWSPETVSEVLTDLGLEVEYVANPHATFDRVVVGAVLTCDKHPKADKLSVCTVDVGEKTPRTIVCGAPNVKEGQTVVVALDGARLPGADFTITNRMLRGVESHGMICSATELNLGDDGSGIMVLASNDTPTSSDSPSNIQVSRDKLVPGTPLAVALNLDVVYDVAITPNRADCLSHVGIARDLQAYMATRDEHTRDGSDVNTAHATAASLLTRRSGLYNAQVETQTQTQTQAQTQVRTQVQTQTQTQTQDQTQTPTHAPSTDTTASVSADANGSVRVENPTDNSFENPSDNPTLAPIYAIQRITGVRVGPSPAWMQQRLRDVGLRPRNIIVDVTNYVNMELGQPLHAFDANKLQTTSLGKPEFIVREQSVAEDFVTLDGKTRSLQPGMLMICDAGGPAAIAGVMGGQRTEIDDASTDICLEGAWFDPRSIRRTARMLGLSTDASYRFERGVDPQCVMLALQRATTLILEYAGGAATGLWQVNTWEKQQPTITVRYERMRMINGIEVSNARMRNMLCAIGCTIVRDDDASCTLVPPSWRSDITAEIDLAEEVMRLHGVNAVPTSATSTIYLSGETLPVQLRANGGVKNTAIQRNLRTGLAARGYSEMLSNVLGSPSEQDAGVVQLQNALGVEFSALRTSLLPTMLKTVAFNLNHGAQTIRMFEFGSVFAQDASSELGIHQTQRLGMVVCGSNGEHWDGPTRTLDLFDLIGDLEAVVPSPLTRKPIEEQEWKGAQARWSPNSVDLYAGAVKLGRVGEVAAKVAASFGVPVPVYMAELDASALLVACRISPKYLPVSAFPTVRRDLAVIVEERISVADIIKVVEQTVSPSYLGASVFDVFRDEKVLGAGRKSVGIAMRFGSNERTLVDADVEASVSAIVQAITQKLGATIRGAV